ncbi:MAG: superoxide dismutase [Rikenellaceae bacterium]
MKHELPKLPYSQDALEPNMSTETLQYHYGKHHAGYIANVNRLIEGTPFENLPLEQIVLEAEGTLFNNASQAWNHTLFFSSLSPNPQSLPQGSLMVAMEKKWGTYDEFRKEFDTAASSLFGSGWTWLVTDTHGHLSITALSNAINPMRDGLTPILVLDVWEHAYYIDYRNRRPDFITAFWKMVDWQVVGKRYISALKPEK